MRNITWILTASLLTLLQFGPSSAQVPSHSDGGAFGIEAGQPLSNLKILKKNNEHSYVIAVPVPNDEFDTYLVYVTPNTGVCRISAIGVNHENDDY